MKTDSEINSNFIKQARKGGTVAIISVKNARV